MACFDVLIISIIKLSQLSFRWSYRLKRLAIWMVSLLTYGRRQADDLKPDTPGTECTTTTWMLPLGRPNLATDSTGCTTGVRISSRPSTLNWLVFRKILNAIDSQAIIGASWRISTRLCRKRAPKWRLNESLLKIKGTSASIIDDSGLTNEDGKPRNFTTLRDTWNNLTSCKDYYFQYYYVTTFLQRLLKDLYVSVVLITFKFFPPNISFLCIPIFCSFTGHTLGDIWEFEALARDSASSSS